MRVTRSHGLLLVAALLPASSPGGLFGPPIDAEQLTAVEFGARSHWHQPWRAYLETMPAWHFLEGIGMVLNAADPDPAPVVRHLAENGIRHGRIEIGWSHIEWEDEDQVRDAGRLRKLLQA